MLNKINTASINLSSGNYYWGEVINGSTPTGTGFYVKPDKSLNVTELHRNGGYDGQFMHRGKDYDEESYLCYIKNGKIYGPYMTFVYEKYVNFSTVDSNCKYDGFYISSSYIDGSYVICYYEHGTLKDRGVCYKDGYLYFVNVDSKRNVTRYLTKISTGGGYNLTPWRLFMMPFDKSKKVERIYDYDYDCPYEGKVQVIGGELNGYGIVHWADGDKYFGEFLAGTRNGMGCYHHHNGDLDFGKFYNNYLYGTSMIWYADGGIGRGHYTDGRRDGIFIDTFASNPLLRIANFDGPNIKGCAYYINPNDFRITVTSSDGKILNTYYFG